MRQGQPDAQPGRPPKAPKTSEQRKRPSSGTDRESGRRRGALAPPRRPRPPAHRSQPGAGAATRLRGPCARGPARRDAPWLAASGAGRRGRRRGADGALRSGPPGRWPHSDHHAPPSPAAAPDPCPHRRPGVAPSGHAPGGYFGRLSRVDRAPGGADAASAGHQDRPPCRVSSAPVSPDTIPLSRREPRGVTRDGSAGPPGETAFGATGRCLDTLRGRAIAHRSPSPRLPEGGPRGVAPRCRLPVRVPVCL
jgi:hypothetical protein